MKINLYCPVRESATTLALTLESHDKLEGITDRFYFDDNDDIEASELLAKHIRIGAQGSFESKPDYTRDGRTHHWSVDSMVRMARVRHTGMHAIFTTVQDCDAILIVDSDVMMHPKTAVHLAEQNVPVVSEVYWTQWAGWSRSNREQWAQEPHMPQVWDVHNYNFWGVDRVLRLREPGLYDVNGLGGCTLITREAFNAGAQYTYIPGVDLLGEDRHFCIRAAVVGIQLYVDTTYPAYHLYRPDAQTKEMLTWRDEYNCDPEFFRQSWLTRTWEQKIKDAFESFSKR